VLCGSHHASGCGGDGQQRGVGWLASALGVPTTKWMCKTDPLGCAAPRAPACCQLPHETNAGASCI